MEARQSIMRAVGSYVTYPLHRRAASKERLIRPRPYNEVTERVVPLHEFGPRETTATRSSCVSYGDET